MEHELEKHVSKEELSTGPGGIPLEAEYQYASSELDMDKATERRILNKIDYAIIPYVSLLYLLSFLDRVNIGQAKVAGLNASLHLTSNQYSISLTVFFVSYVFFETPSNWVLTKVPPHQWICFITVCWSIVMTLMGTVRTYGQLTAVRFLLGIFEAGLFPGLNFMLSTWYPREKLGLRVSLFFAGATLSGSFGGLLAAAIRKMDGLGGYEGWRWIFIIEGLMTFVAAVPAWWLIQDFPAEAKLLNDQDRKRWIHHLIKSQGLTSTTMAFQWKYVTRAFTDWRTYIYSLLYLSIAEGFYSVSLFLPTIIAGLGYTGIKANLLSTPPFFLGFIVTVVLALFSDKYRMRAPLIIGCMSLCIVGYIIIITHPSPGVSYFALHLAVAGVCPSIALAITFVAPNFGPILTRSSALGLFFSSGNAAGIISSWVYPATSSPRYIEGHAVAIAFSACAVFCAALLMWDCKRRNAQRDRLYGPAPVGVNVATITDPELLRKWGIEGYTHEQILDLGDHHPAFRYLY